MTKIQITFDKNCKKFKNFEGKCITFKEFENEIQCKFSLIAAEIYFIDRNKNIILIEKEQDYKRLFTENVGDSIKFFVNEYISGCDSTANVKLDTRNLRYNYESREQRNDGKPWNLLINLKKQKSLIKKSLEEICGGDNRCLKQCTCEHNQKVMIMENMLKEIKHFNKLRLKRKFWKSSKNNHQSNVNIDSMIA